MRQLLVLAVPVLLASQLALAQAPAAGSCEAKAVSKDGKPLSGAAKSASIKKCERETAAAAPVAPVAKAPPAATAPAKSSQQDKMKECNKQAEGKKGDERKAFMKECLSNK
ncbi:MAG TPA: PsiF family protein [Rhodocyclaceae bacterium]|nr:PsiF family protein [Rhodocyclaceae bacterium]